MEGVESRFGWKFWSNKNGDSTSTTTLGAFLSYGLGLGHTVAVLVLILTWQLLMRWSCFQSFMVSVKARKRVAQCSTSRPASCGAKSAAEPSHLRTKSTIISDDDLKYLIDNLDADFRHQDENWEGGENWEDVIHKSNNLLSYTAKCCKPKNGPLKYLSVTVFENCSPELLRDFYMDNDYRKLWDKTVIDHKQLEVDVASGTEIGRTIKKFPLLTPREYILAWRVWEGINQSFYCFSKECEHAAAPRQKKYVRVSFFRSGWRITKVPGRNACQIKMLHQEDAGLNVEMAKLAFSKGIWSYVRKMDNALRKYSATNHIPSRPAMSAVTLIHKVPVGLECTDDMASTSSSEYLKGSAGCRQLTPDRHKKKLLRRPSSKLIANGLILLGGAVCLSRCNSDLGAKVAMAYILSKFSKRSGSATQNRQVQR